MPTQQSKSARRRVVITGMGAVSAAGLGAEALWKAARDGVSQVRPLKLERPYTGRIEIAAQVSRFRSPPLISRRNFCPIAIPSSQFAVVAADEAMAQAGYRAQGCRRAAHGGCHRHRDRRRAPASTTNAYHEYKFENPGPITLTVPRVIPSAAPTTARACATAPRGRPSPWPAPAPPPAQAIGEGLEMLRAGRADRAIAGGAEACVNFGSMQAWEAAARAHP